MSNTKTNLKNSNYYYKFIIEKKYLIITLFVLVLFILFTGGFGIVKHIDKNSNVSEEKICGDGTLYNNCSLTKPYFCSEGKLIELASACECPENFTIENNFCISYYQTEPKEISLKYTLRGEENYIPFVVYGGFANYVYDLPRSIRYSSGENFSRADFKLKAINEEEQRKFILPLVIKIQNITNDKEDQARIAISIVQNIPFGASNRTSTFANYKINYSRYPYDVLYDMQGICGEKTDLLTFILEEMGYGTAFFYYPSYNHEAFGIKCPVKESLIESGYCFVETTGPSILTDDMMSYVGMGKLYSYPEVYIVSDGIALGEDIYEYYDAEKLIKIRGRIEDGRQINAFRNKAYEELFEKYGLAEEYYGG